MSISGNRDATRQLPVLRGLHRRTAPRSSDRSRESVYERGHEARRGKKVPGSLSWPTARPVSGRGASNPTTGRLTGLYRYPGRHVPSQARVYRPR